MLNEKLLKILCCPETKAPLVYDDGRLVSTHPKIHRVYRIDEDIPVLLVDESELLSEEEWRQVIERHNLKAD